jgi:hypothetical protein
MPEEEASPQRLRALCCNCGLYGQHAERTEAIQLYLAVLIGLPF